MKTKSAEADKTIKAGETGKSAKAGKIVKAGESAQSVRPDDISEKIAKSDCDIDYYNAVQSGKIGKIIAVTITLGVLKQSMPAIKCKGGTIPGIEPLAIYPDMQKMPAVCFRWETLRCLRIRYNRTKGFMVAIFRGELVASSGTSRPCFVYGPWFRIIEDAYQTMIETSIQAEIYRRPEVFYAGCN